MKHRLLQFFGALTILLFLVMPGNCKQVLAGEYLPAYPNTNRTLSVPTQVTKIGDTCYLVDCYHNRVLFSDSVGTVLTNWQVMDYDYNHPHAIAGDGRIFMVVDTDNNRIVTYRKMDKGYERLESLEVGIRPHDVAYDEEDGLFYVWSSMTGEMYRYRRKEDSFKVELEDVHKIPELDGLYTRSFTLIDGSIYLPSMGRGAILQLDQKTFEVKKRYLVPAEMGGMVQLSKIQDYWYLTYSSDQAYDQTHHGLVRVRKLSDFGKGKIEDLSRYLEGNAPYAISCVDGIYYVPVTGYEELPSGMYTFQVNENQLTKCYKIVQ